MSRGPRMAVLLLAAALLTVGSGPSVSLAGPVSFKTHTDVRHYPVSGRNELAMLRDMRRNGPRVGGQPALASTRMQTRYSAQLRQRGGPCRVQRLQIETHFTVTLPRLRRSSVPSRHARKRWPAFVRRLRQHEDRHISIWRSCLRRVQRQLPRLTATSCQALKQRMRTTYRRIMEQCSRRHDAFDRREQHAAASLPFIRAALRLVRARPSSGQRLKHRQTNGKAAGRSVVKRNNWQR